MSQEKRQPVTEVLKIVPPVFSTKAEHLGANQEGSVSSQGFSLLANLFLLIHSSALHCQLSRLPHRPIAKACTWGGRCLKSCSTECFLFQRPRHPTCIQIAGSKDWEVRFTFAAMPRSEPECPVLAFLPSPVPRLRRWAGGCLPPPPTPALLWP